MMKDISKDQIKQHATNFFQKSKAKLWSFGKQEQELTLSLPPAPSDDVEIEKRLLAKVKSKTKLERLYMIDILERGKKEIEIIMHFVNKHFNPTMSPVIKRFRMTLDQTTQDFLINLQHEISQSSHLVSKVANANFSLHDPSSSSSQSGLVK